MTTMSDITNSAESKPAVRPRTDPVVAHVRGTASADATADYADLAVSVQAQNADRKLAIEQVESLLADLRAAITAADDVRSVTMSQVSVQQSTRWDERAQRSVDDGWIAQARGRVRTDSADVNEVLARILGAEAQLDHITWGLDPENAIVRAVRKDAVADAFRAARDFADALDASVGALVALSDPGLLGVGAGAGVMESGPGSALFARAAGTPVQVNVDPALIEVGATVEATFHLT